MPKIIDRLYRYTSLAIALDALYSSHLTLLSPESWEDRNDAYYLERYRDERHLRTVLAACFSLSTETFHHWRVFAPGTCGVCIQFNKVELLAFVDGRKGFRHEQVQYPPIWNLTKNKPDLDRWPFLKHSAFKAEDEYRIIYESKTESCQTHSIPIDLSCICAVVLSPWLPERVSKSIESIIRKIDGCQELRVTRSALIDNAQWREIIK